MARLVDLILEHQEIKDAFFLSSAPLSGGFLFAGPSGIGKTGLAWALMQKHLCESRALAPCGACPSCYRVERHQHESIFQVETEATQIKIEEIRALTHFLSFQKIRASQFVLIHNAHKLNVQASNALLKSLEEPPEGTCFIFVTSQPDSLIATIRSRLKKIRFKPLSSATLSQLRPQAPEWILRASRGQLDRLDMLLESDSQDGLKLRAEMFWKLMKNEIGTDQLMSSIKDVNEALQTLEIWTYLLRDQVCGTQVDAIYSEHFLKRPEQIFNQQVWDDLYLSMTQARSDLLGHVDRGLIFEELRRQMRSIFTATR